MNIRGLIIIGKFGKKELGKSQQLVPLKKTIIKAFVIIVREEKIFFFEELFVELAFHFDEFRLKGIRDFILIFI